MSAEAPVVVSPMRNNASPGPCRSPWDRTCGNPGCRGATVVRHVGDGSLSCPLCGLVVELHRLDDSIAGTSGRLARDDQGCIVDDCHDTVDLETLRLKAPVPATVWEGFGADAVADGLMTGADARALVKAKQNRVAKQKLVSRLTSTEAKREARTREVTEVRGTTIQRTIRCVHQALDTPSITSTVVTLARDVLDSLSRPPGPRRETVIKAVSEMLADETWPSVTNSASLRRRGSRELIALLSSSFAFYVTVVLATLASFSPGSTHNIKFFIDAAQSIDVSTTGDPREGAKRPRGATRDTVTPQEFQALADVMSKLVRHLNEKFKVSRSLEDMSRLAASKARLEVLSPTRLPQTSLSPRTPLSVRSAGTPGGRRKKMRHVSSAECLSKALRRFTVDYHPRRLLSSSGGGGGGGGGGAKSRDVSKVAMVTVVALWWSGGSQLSKLRGINMPPFGRDLLRALMEVDVKLGGLALASPLVAECGGQLDSGRHIGALMALSDDVGKAGLTSEQSTKIAALCLIYYCLVLPYDVKDAPDASPRFPVHDTERVNKVTNGNSIIGAHPVMMHVLEVLRTHFKLESNTIVTAAAAIGVGVRPKSSTLTKFELLPRVADVLVDWFSVSFKRRVRHGKSL